MIRAWRGRRTLGRGSPFSTKVSSGWPHDTEAGLSAIRATAATVGGFPLLAVLIYVADEHPPVYAGTRTLQAGVVGLYSVVLLLSRWVRVGCARLCGVHWGPFPLGRVPGSGRLLRDHFSLSDDYIILQ